MKKHKKAILIVLICVCALAAICTAGYYIMRSRDFQLFGKIVCRADTDKKIVALTFDDGPSDRTPEILAELDRLDLKCTFFLTGKGIKENMDYARAIAEAGHQIGNHSFSHERMIFKSAEFIDSEIDDTNRLIREAGYAGEIVFRPPHCLKLIMLPLALQKRGITAITWDVEPDSYPDVASGPEGIAAYVMEHAKCGSIVLLHIMYDGGQNAREALPAIVEGMRSKGYEFVTVNELLEAAGQ